MRDALPFNPRPTEYEARGLGLFAVLDQIKRDGAVVWSMEVDRITRALPRGACSGRKRSVFFCGQIKGEALNCEV